METDYAMFSCIVMHSNFHVNLKSCKIDLVSFNKVVIYLGCTIIQYGILKIKYNLCL